MKIFAPSLLFVLSACAAPANDKTSSQAGPPALAAGDLPNKCDAAAGQYAIGQTFTDALAAELKNKVRANSLRIIPPDTLVTMEYRGDRLNINYDDKKLITAVACG